jgi:Beta propeller domain
MSPVPRAASRRLAATVLGLVAVLAVGACGGGSSGDDPPPPGPTTPDPTLKPVSQPGEFVAQVRTLVAARAAQGRNNTGIAAPASAGAVADGSVAELFSTTTRQEEGVDEDDLVKTDGQRVYSFGAPPSGSGPGSGSGSALAALQTVQVHRRQGDGSLAAAQSVTLHDDAPDDYQLVQGLQLATEASRLVAMRRGYSITASPCPPDAICIAASIIPVGVTTTLDLMSLDANSAIGATTNVQIQGDLIASRRVGSTLYLVMQHLPYLRAELAATEQERAAALATLTASEVLPTVRIDGGAPMPLLTETDCFVQPGNTSTSTTVTTITAVDLGAASFSAASRCFLGGTEAVYMSTANVYLTTSRWPQPTIDAQGRTVFASGSDPALDIHKFALAAPATASTVAGVTYRASGSVPGHFGWDPVRAAYRMSEHQGDLRVVTFTGSFGWATPADANSAIAPSPATLSVLRENAATRMLDVIGKLPSATRPALIGKPGEQVQAVRFAGERAYVVTFRRIDPLYVLDLSNPADPLQAGALEVTGFSEHLYPLANGLLLGVGREADAQGMTQAVKLALFDVANPAQPSVLATELYGGPMSSTALDTSPHGIAFLDVGNNVVRVALPMVLGSSPFAPPDPSSRALQRVEVDTGARTLRRLNAVAPPSSDLAGYYFGADRGLMIGAQVYYYSMGSFSTAAW